VSDGQALGGGTVFFSSGVFATDRFDGSGVFATDRVAFGDGVFATDGRLEADAAAQALSAATEGDATRAPPPATEAEPDSPDDK
jgi:hypothetical protein